MLFRSSKGDVVAAVQVKWLKNNVAAPQILKFVDFLDSEAGQQFNYGIFITTKDYSGSARALIKSWGKDTNIRCGIAGENKIIWVNGESDEPSPQPPKEKIYFGVFTCKGGVDVPNFLQEYL